MNKLMSFIVCSAITKKGTQCTKRGYIKSYDANLGLLQYCGQHGKIILGSSEKIEPIEEIIKIPPSERNTCINSILTETLPLVLIKIIIDYDYVFEGKLLYTLNTNTENNKYCLPLPDGRIVTLNDDNTIKILGKTYNKSSRFEDLLLIGHTKRIVFIDILKDGTIFSSSKDLTYKIWDPNTGICLSTIDTETTNISFVSLLPNNKFIIKHNEIEGRYFQIWDLNTKLPELTINTYFLYIFDLLPRNRIIIMTSHAELSIINLNTYTLESKIMAGTHIYNIKCIDEFVIVSDFEGTITVWKDIDMNYECIKSIKIATSVAYFSQLNTDYILSGSSTGVIRIFYIPELISEIKKPHLKRLTIKEIKLKGHTKELISTKLMLDGRVITTSRDKSIRIWNFMTGICDFKFPDLESIQDITLLPDGKIAYISENKIKIWG